MSFIINPYRYAGEAFTGLLDDYSGASVAVSMRWVNSAYTGALVRIRRSSDSAEKDFYPDSSNKLSMSSTDGAGTSLSSWISTDSGYVTTWYGQDAAGATGSGEDGTQTTAGQQPRIVNAGTLDTENGEACLVFDGTDDEFDLNSFANGDTNLSAFCVWNAGTGDNFEMLFTHSDGLGSSGRIEIGRKLTNDEMRWNISASLTGNGVNTINSTQTLISFTRDFSPFGMFMYIDGVQDDSFSSGTPVAIGNYNAQIGARNSIYNLAGTMQEIIYYPSDETSNRVAIQDNINTHYTIY